MQIQSRMILSYIVVPKSDHDGMARTLSQHALRGTLEIAEASHMSALHVSCQVSCCNVKSVVAIQFPRTTMPSIGVNTKLPMGIDDSRWTFLDEVSLVSMVIELDQSAAHD